MGLVTKRCEEPEGCQCGIESMAEVNGEDGQVITAPASSQRESTAEGAGLPETDLSAPLGVRAREITIHPVLQSNRQSVLHETDRLEQQQIVEGEGLPEDDLSTPLAKQALMYGARASSQYRLRSERETASTQSVQPEQQHQNAQQFRKCEGMLEVDLSVPRVPAAGKTLHPLRQLDTALDHPRISAVGEGLPEADLSAPLSKQALMYGKHPSSQYRMHSERKTGLSNQRMPFEHTRLQPVSQTEQREEEGLPEIDLSALKAQAMEGRPGYASEANTRVNFDQRQRAEGEGMKEFDLSALKALEGSESASYPPLKPSMFRENDYQRSAENEYLPRLSQLTNITMQAPELTHRFPKPATDHLTEQREGEGLLEADLSIPLTCRAPESTSRSLPQPTQQLSLPHASEREEDNQQLKVPSKQREEGEGLLEIDLSAPRPNQGGGFVLRPFGQRGCSSYSQQERRRRGFAHLEQWQSREGDGLPETDLSAPNAMRARELVVGPTTQSTNNQGPIITGEDERVPDAESLAEQPPAELREVAQEGHPPNKQEREGMLEVDLVGATK
ncbi:unnamed protein product [Cylicocyclus nassatus]|uniref:Uncharacterized protein n=1 Tax=Cylicocyclus nassatus TaxID=53992 RepID=A0AA36H6L9_CYLNA|nr:unnamed protein product [Cylicocyclus nassatus]